MRKLLIYCLVLIHISTYAQFEWKFEAGYIVSDVPWDEIKPNPEPIDIGGTYLDLDSLFKPSVREHAIGGIINENEIYVYGGHANNDLDDSDLWIYDISQSKWAFVKHYNTNQTIDVINGESEYNSPGRLSRAASDFDNDGNLWVFGGLKFDFQHTNALWSLNSKTHKWTYWDIPNGPISRFRVRGWIFDNKFWIYGGVFANQWGSYAMNDLWYFDLNTKVWHFVKGDKNVSFPANNQYSPPNGNYPNSIRTKGPEFFPRSRSDYGYWVDHSGNFWIYGGFLSAHGLSNFSDIWKFHTNDLEWELIEGTNDLDEFRSSSHPGARNAPYCWVNESGKLMMFGGNTEGDKFLSDMWQYDPILYKWDSIQVKNTINTVTLINDKASWPGAQVCNLSHISTRNFTYMFNGYGYGTNNQAGFKGTLWKYPIRNIDSLEIPKVINQKIISNKSDSTIYFLANENSSGTNLLPWKNVDINPHLAGFQDSVKTSHGKYKISKAGQLTFKLDSYEVDQTTLDTSYIISDSIQFIALSENGYFSNPTKGKFVKFPCDTNSYLAFVSNDSLYNNVLNLSSSNTIQLNGTIKNKANSQSNFSINSFRSIELLPGFEIAANNNANVFIKPEGCPELELRDPPPAGDK